MVRAEVSPATAEVSEVSPRCGRCRQRGQRCWQQWQKSRCQVSMTKVSSRLQVSGVDNEHGQEVSTVRAEVSQATAEVSEVSPRCGRCRQRGQRCRQQWQRSRCQVSMTKVSSRLQVSGVDNEHGQEVSAARAEVLAATAEVSEVSL